jgi:hypothetical protein
MLVILLIPVFSHAIDINDCARLRGNEKIQCMAIATLNVGDCDRITNLDLRISCTKKVRDGQREVNSFHPTKR